MRQGLSEESLELLKPNLPLQLASSEPALWRELTQASALGYLERFPEAQAVLAKAHLLAEASHPKLLGEVFLRQGTLASLQWEFAGAQANFAKALDFSRANQDKFLEASALGSFGVLTTRMEHFDESADWNKQALELAKAQDAISLVAKIEGNIAWSAHELGDFEGALTLYEQAEKDAIRGGLNHERILWLTNSAVVHYELHKYGIAQDEAEEALRLALKLGDPSDVIECYQNAALVAMQNSRTQDALRDLEEASRLAQTNPDLQRDLYTSLLSAHLAVRTGGSSKAGSIYATLAANPKAPMYVHWESEAGLAKVYASQGRVKEAEAQFEKAIATIAKARSDLEREDLRFAFLSNAIQFYDQYINFLIGLNRQVDALKVADLSRAQTLEAGLTSWVIGKNGQPTAEPAKFSSSRAYRPEEIAARFGATLLFYWLGPEESHLWVVTAKKTTEYSLPPGAEIDQAIVAYRKTILEDPRDPLESRNESGRKLYDLLIRPAEKAIPKNSRIIILPDGNLDSLNFETLPVFEPQPHYWIEDATISIANSLSLLSRARRDPPPNSGKLLFFGAPVSPSKEFPPLADEEKETNAVKQYFPEGRRTLFLGKDAKASSYLSSDPGKFSYIHFATHGTASVSRPLESAIILTREGDSFKLYARDIVKRPLNAYLVSISACDGVGKRNYAGEGLIGLSWAFLRAGAHNVVAGLWEVSTASTPQIMDELYKGLHDRKDPAMALRNAKLSLIHSTGQTRRPFYWAPFQLYTGS